MIRLAVRVPVEIQSLEGSKPTIEGSNSIPAITTNQEVPFPPTQGPSWRDVHCRTGSDICGDPRLALPQAMTYAMTSVWISYGTAVAATD